MPDDIINPAATLALPAAILAVVAVGVTAGSGMAW